MLIDTADSAAALLKPLFRAAEAELVATAHLDSERRLIRVIEEMPGAVDEAELPVRSILAAAMALDASGLIVAHNHPSGDPNPSEADLAATRLLVDSARGLSITVHDHLIFAGSECRSLRALQLM